MIHHLQLFSPHPPITINRLIPTRWFLHAVGQFNNPLDYDGFQLRNREAAIAVHGFQNTVRKNAVF